MRPAPSRRSRSALPIIALLGGLAGPACGGAAPSTAPTAAAQQAAAQPAAAAPAAAAPPAAVPAQELTGHGLRAPVQVVRDRYGIPHIYASSADDAAYAQGFVMAHDRLPQMDILRRYATGTLAELFGALDSSVIDADIRMRVQQLRPLAAKTLELLQSSSDPTDRAIARSMQRFADGVNEYARQLRDTDRWSLDPAVAATFRPQAFAPWTAVDSLALGRFQVFALSFSADVELTLSELVQRLGTTFTPGKGPELAARVGIAADLLRLTPLGQVAPLPGFPNLGTDTGSRADGGSRATGATGATGPAAGPRAQAATPAPVPLSLYDQALTMFPPTLRTGPLGALGSEAFRGTRAGSNNWAVAPANAGGKALLATDQHLQLSNPSLFYPSHLVIEGDGAFDLDAFGVTFPGIPGVILGANRHLAWSGTAAYHDVNDVYAETVVPCPAGECVLFGGKKVPIEKRTEVIGVGLLGTITSRREVTLEVVPHHGPILPTVSGGKILPRTGPAAFSVRYTGYQPSFESRAIWELSRARDVDAAFAALRHFAFGAQNWVFIDDAGNIAWSAHAQVPVRGKGATSGGRVPYLVLPGDGSAEWEGVMSSRYLPHAKNPASGYLVTANADPTGQTFDGDAVNQPEVDGRPLYLGGLYNDGVRHERISHLLERVLSRGPATLDDLARIQHDSSSTIGAKLAPHLVAALAYVTEPRGAPADVGRYVARLTAAQRARLTAARDLLAGWSFATPAAVEPSASPDHVRDSAATALFNTWMHFFLASTIDDELARAGFARSRLEDSLMARLAHALLVEPTRGVRSKTTGQAILCDRLDVRGPDDSCTRMAIAAALAALDHLASPAGYGSADPTTWRWGAKHRLTLRPAFPNPALTLPTAAESPDGGFPRAGDTSVINRADAGWHDTDFAQLADGAAQRFLAEAAPKDRVRVRWQLPGGVELDPRGAHYRDLLDRYYLRETHLAVPLEPAEVAAAAEVRWTLR